MLKGSRRQLIVVRTGGSRYFDEAYFILRREMDASKTGREDILREANRILQESIPECKRKRRRLALPVSFLLGLLIGGGCVALLCLLL